MDHLVKAFMILSNDNIPVIRNLILTFGLALIFVAGESLQEVKREGVGESGAKPRAEERAGIAEGEISFSRDVLPILSNKCFRCHGPDEKTREAGLQLDVEGEAREYGAVIPHDAEGSEMMVRILSDELDEKMPPVESGIEAVTDQEALVLRQWIQAGAKWQTHWAFVAPKKPELPDVELQSWVQNPVDQFVLARLEEDGLRPSSAANKSTLIRRASLLITGLPPDPELVEGFLRDSSPNAYEKVVDKLFESPAFGERMAAAWMDLARFSDTDGFQGDEPRSNWPWRDWVTEAYNGNMPFDQFTMEQFAGDLLQHSTDRQVLATCFHRNHMTNGEGGRDPEESRVDYVLDRVNTMGTAWLGLTLGCAQCHTHKYDPITQKEYYQLTAFFNSIDEDGRAGRNAKPFLDWPVKDINLLLERPLEKVKRRNDELARKRAVALQKFDDWIKNLFHDRRARLDHAARSDWKILEIDDVKATDKNVVFEAVQDGSWRVREGNPNNETYTVTGSVQHASIGAIRLEALPDESFTNGGLARSNSGNFVLTDVVAHIVRDQSGGTGGDKRIELDFVSASSDYAQPGFPVLDAIDPVLDTGWAVWSGDMKRPRIAVFRLRESQSLAPGDRLEIKLVHFSHHAGHNIGKFRLSVSPSVDATRESRVTEILEQVDEAGSLANDHRQELQQHFLAHDGQVGLAEALLDRSRQELEKAKAENVVPVMVLKERASTRETFVLMRGVWDAHGEQVEAGTPTALLPEMQASASNNRLDLARWLVNRKNPLTARVAVNRYWQMYFGAGLVRTPQDFGLQGEHPTHPALLDWLAVRFMESGWNIKELHKLIVMSATFRQSSVNTRQLLQVDPDNRLLARGPRFRMPASMIRDNALAVSGLLSRRVGGPPVKPYQPENVWVASDQGKFPYVQASGENLYRRSLYTYWRRNIAPPGMFDAAQRRVCEINVRRTNSPMHALTLLNDETYVEAARILAQTALQQSAGSNDDLIRWLFRRVLFRKASSLEVRQLSASLSDLKTVYSEDPELTKQLLRQGEQPFDKNLEPAELAALTVIASTLLNLDETLNVE